MNDDDQPTPKDSGTLPIFEGTCEEAINKLGGYDTDRADELRHEARSLLVILRTWRVTAPTNEDRSLTISRVLDLHRSTASYLTAYQYR